jgi:ADP-ribosyl-[dinitrogen reductase] hydrolase
MHNPENLDADQVMAPGSPSVKDRYIGTMLGMAIGDALGMPVRGLTRAQIADQYGALRTYEPLLDESGIMRVPAGQFTDNTELAMCLAESLVTSNGFLDPDTAGFRFEQVLRSDYNHFLGDTTRAALERATETGDYQAGSGGDGSAGASPAARVAPVSLVHALGDFNSEVLVREVLRSSLITHAHPDSVNGALAVAYAARLMVRRELPPELLIDEVLAFIDEDAVAARLRLAKRLLDGGTDTDSALDQIGTSGYVAEAVAAAFFLFARHNDTFDEAVFAAVNAGGATSTIATITGALAGAWTGAEKLPPQLVDGLDGRMYILMAAPTVLRIAQMRAGLYLQLHQR